MFKLGQRVVCIDGGSFPNPLPYGEAVPIEGRTYTIRNVVQECVRLREIVNRPNQYQEGMMECLFKVTRFKAKRGKG